MFKKAQVTMHRKTVQGKNSKEMPWSLVKIIIIIIIAIILLVNMRQKCSAEIK